MMKPLKEDTLKRKKRISHHSVPMNGLSKNPSLAHALYESSFLYFPEKEEWRKRLIYSMFEWAKHPDSLVLEFFCLEYGIIRQTLYDWGQKYEDIRQGIEAVKIFIGARRRKGAMKNELNGIYAYKDMHLYDEEWKSVNTYHAKLSADAKAQAVQEFAVKSTKEYIVIGSDGKVLNE